MDSREKIIDHLQKLRFCIQKDTQHTEILADLFLEEGINCVVKEMQWDTMPRHKITLKVEIFL